MPDLMIYGGLSGLDCALYSLLMVLFIKREIRSRSWIWMALFSLLLAGLVAKIICETTTGLTIFVANTHTNMVPVPLAHLVGGCIGFFISLAGVKSGKAPCRIWPPNLNYLSAFHPKTLINRKIEKSILYNFGTQMNADCQDQIF